MSDIKRIVLNIDTELTGGTVTRFVARSSKIIGLAESIYGHVIVSIQSSENSPIQKVIVTNSFDEVAEFMLK